MVLVHASILNLYQYIFGTTLPCTLFSEGLTEGLSSHT